MTRFIAFLRGINVGGQKIIKMEDLSKIFSSSGFSNVKTYIQSGNVIFDSSEKDSPALTQKIEKNLLTLLGYDVTILLRTTDEVEQIINLNPFKNIKPDDNTKMYVTFISEEPNKKPSLPLLSSKKDVEVFQIKNLNIFSLSHRINGSFGFPNRFIEKELGVSATTRNWTTVSKIIKLAYQTEKNSKIKTNL